MPDETMPPQLTEEQQLRVRRIRTLCNEFIDKLAENQISVWEVINENGALTFISREIQGRPIMPMNELGQPAVYTKQPVGDNIKDLIQPVEESTAEPAKEEPDAASV